MKQKLEAALEAAVRSLLRECGDEGGVRVRLTRPRQGAHGDYAANVAMPLASRLEMKPLDVARRLVARVQWPPAVERAEIAPPGFINIHLKRAAEAEVLLRIMDAGDAYGCVKVDEKASRICLEFVSANPTGPMHVGHGRGAVVGDTLANILHARGGRVHREYYINDAGRQIEILAASVWLRMREMQGEHIEFPKEAYPGDYVKDVARALLAEKNFDVWEGMDERSRLKRIGEHAVAIIMEGIRSDLAALGIHFDNYFSEHSLHASGRVQELIDRLKAEGLAYRGTLPPPKGKPVQDYQTVEQWLFRTTRFGDDVDRPLLKQDGSPTYFAADIAYHLDKHARGFDRMIDVWGADHGGYVVRLQAAMEALTGRKQQPEVVLVQMVNLTRHGRPLRMSKRAGTFVTLREVVNEVGKDAVRFNFLTRRAESQLDFDLETAKARSDENPVYYVQYAHARACAVLRKAEEAGIGLGDTGTIDLQRLSTAAEQTLIKHLLHYPEILETAAVRLEPYRVAVFLLQLAADLHAYYHRHRVLGDDRSLTRARLLLMQAVRQVLANGLTLLGVEAPARM